jgi:hypothetical protein
VDGEAEYMSCLQVSNYFAQPKRIIERIRRSFKENKEVKGCKGPYSQ